jgi:hypothetical protein
MWGARTQLRTSNAIGSPIWAPSTLYLHENDEECEDGEVLDDYTAQDEGLDITEDEGLQELQRPLLAIMSIHGHQF